MFIRRQFPSVLDDSPEKECPGIYFTDPVIFAMIFSAILAIFASSLDSEISAKVPDSPSVPSEALENRQIILDVPQESSINVQVISGDSQIDLQNL